jgi:hypothetical protein
MDRTVSSKVYTAEECAAQFGVSNWSWYQSIRRGDCPAPVIRVGRRIIHPRAAVDAMLGITSEDS